MPGALLRFLADWSVLALIVALVLGRGISKIQPPAPGSAPDRDPRLEASERAWLAGILRSHRRQVRLSRTAKP